jgi:hypothetical protein
VTGEAVPIVVVVVLGTLVVVEVVLVVVVAAMVVVGAAAAEQADRTRPSATTFEYLVGIRATIRRSWSYSPSTGATSEDSSSDLEMGQRRLRLIQGDGQLDAVGVRLEDIHGVDVDPSVGD